MRKARILTVEDDIDVQRINREYLEGLGYDVSVAATLKEARGLIPFDAPDLILQDIMMPDGSGLQFAGEIREMTNAPVIFLTCKDDNESVLQGLREGDDYITKPYDLNVLGARVAAMLRRSGFSLAGLISLPPLSIDLLSGSVELAGELVRLSPKEIQLLSCFALSQGATCAARISICASGASR